MVVHRANWSTAGWRRTLPGNSQQHLQVPIDEQKKAHRDLITITMHCLGLTFEFVVILEGSM